ncbi:MAG TPA: polysaccharide deacetylase family protein [Propionibacteriaceae bacterium]|nr:polysaccharide deacetylase family protein [Propionibacteriaceae bacterium]
MKALAAAARATAVGVSALGVVAYWTGFRPRSQTFGSFPYAAETEERVVALSFDDGPNEPYTSRLLDTLDHYDVKATFFQVGRCAQRFPSTTRRVVESGHVLGNHSYSHSFTRYLKQPRQEIEIIRSQEVFYSITGLTPALYRPPWLCHWPWVLSTLRHHGLQVVSGTFAHPLEIFQPAADTLADSAARLTRPGTILIFHDGLEARGGPRDQSVAGIGPLIDRLADRGYRFTTVDQLLGVRAYAG